MASDLLTLFNAQRGIICCVGAGGKKTTMFRLAVEHPGRVAITATAHIEYFPRRLQATRLVAPETELLAAVAADKDSRVIAFAQPSQREGRHAGIDPAHVHRFRQAGRFDLMLIKADGARSRLIKAPAAHEPPLPRGVDTVIPVVSAKAIGRKLDERMAHRIDQLATVTGLRPGQMITPSHVARLLASSHGSLKNTGDATVVPLINMVDDESMAVLAREAASEALSLTNGFRYVVLASMRAQAPIVDVIYRYQQPETASNSLRA